MKNLADVTAPDERQRLFEGSLADLHGELERITLNAQVPENVRDLFDTAINLSLFSWFVYDFHRAADLTGFLALEAAFRARASQQSKRLANKPLKELVRHALQAGWVADERLGSQRAIARVRVQQRKTIEAIKRAKASGATEGVIDEPTEEEVSAETRAMRVIEAMCIAGVDLRNALAHGRRMLVSGSQQRLRITADLINQLFPEKAREEYGN